MQTTKPSSDITFLFCSALLVKNSIYSIDKCHKNLESMMITNKTSTNQL